MEKKISTLSPAEIEAVVGGVKTVSASAQLSVRPTVNQPAIATIQPVRFEALLAR